MANPYNIHFAQLRIPKWNILSLLLWVAAAYMIVLIWNQIFSSLEIARINELYQPHAEFDCAFFSDIFS